MKEVRPVMPWVKVYIPDIVYTDIWDWCVDTVGVCGVNWYISTGEGGAEIFCSFRYEEDATAFKLKFGL